MDEDVDAATTTGALDGAAVAGVVAEFWSLGGEVFDLDHAVLVRHAVAPAHPLGNFVSDLRADTAEQIDAVLTRAHEIIGGTCERVLIDADTPPTAEGHLALNDWKLSAQLQLVLPDSVTPPGPTQPWRPVADRAEDWSSIESLFRIDHLEEDARAARPPRPAAETSAAVRLRRSLTPAVRYFVGERDSTVLACVAVWVGASGVGLIEDVFVHPEARGRGIATDMLRHAVTHARSRGAGPVLIGAEVDNTPKRLYATFGFQPVAVTRSYDRTS